MIGEERCKQQERDKGGVRKIHAKRRLAAIGTVIEG